MKSRGLRLLAVVIIVGLLGGLPGTALAINKGEAFNWWQERVDSPLTFKNMTPHSLAVTSTGVVHIVYGGDHLYHAVKNGASVTIETVDPAWGVGSFASLAIDSAGKLHVAYLDSSAGRLKYATNRYGSWQVGTPSFASGLNASNAAIAVDAGNDPHIVFFSGDGTLRYGFFDSGYGAWMGPETLASGVWQLFYPGAFALAVGPLATPQVSYHKHTTDYNGALYYTKRLDVDTWSTPLALAIGGSSGGDYNDIALSGSTPYIAASTVSTVSPGVYLNEVRFTFLDGAAWHASEPVTFTTNNSAAAPPAAIVLRLSGTTPYIAYHDPEAGYYWQYRQGNDSWSSEEAIAGAATSGSWASFALYSNNLYATYYDTVSRRYFFRYKLTAVWQAPTELVTNGDEVGSLPALAVDSLGRSHITYGYNYPTSRLLYARYDGASWYRRTVDSGPVYPESALALDQTQPQVLYYGRDGTVRYSILVCPLDCYFSTPEIVDSGLTTSGGRAGLMIHAATGVHAAYVKNGALIYAQRTAPNTWSKTTIDSGLYGGISLALSPAGAPSLMYRKAGSLYYAYKDTTWHPGILIATGTFGYTNTFRVGPQGQVAAAYIEYVGSTANVIYTIRLCFGSCYWLPVTVDQASGMTDFVDLAFDSQGVPHLAYYGLPNDSLKFAERPANSWVTRVIDSRPWLGDLSLAISPLGGRARIAYVDTTNADLKLALEGQQVFLPLVRK